MNEKPSEAVDTNAQIRKLRDDMKKFEEKNDLSRQQLQARYGIVLQQRPNGDYEVDEETLKMSQAFDEQLNEYQRMKDELERLQGEER